MLKGDVAAESGGSAARPGRKLRLGGRVQDVAKALDRNAVV